MGKIWFDFLTTDQKIAESERLLFPHKPMGKIGDHWGYGLNVICAGDEGHAYRAAKKLREDEIKQIGKKLPIWC